MIGGKSLDPLGYGGDFEFVDAEIVFDYESEHEFELDERPLTQANLAMIGRDNPGGDVPRFMYNDKLIDILREAIEPLVVYKYYKCHCGHTTPMSGKRVECEGCGAIVRML